MFDFGINEIIERIIEEGAAKRLSDKGFVAQELGKWLNSPDRMNMITGEKYYHGVQDILNKTRSSIGEDGNLVSIENLPNNKIVDNQYRKMVNQKKNYLFGKPFTIQSDDETYSGYLNSIFDESFMRIIKDVACNAFNNGLAWVYLYYDDAGELSFRRFPAYQILPFWTDAEHTQLDGAVRIYDVLSYNGSIEEKIHKVEVYENTGVSYFEYTSGSLVPVDPWHKSYITMTDTTGISHEYNWTKIPLIPFKYNQEETPLIKMVKSLQDGLNKIESEFEDNMEEDARNTIMVLVNYDGEDLGEFRHNLAAYGAVKVRSTDGASGDVKTLRVQVNAENYKSIIDIFKKAIIENAMGYDAKDDRLGGNANQMNIQSIYSDIDLDANDMDTEFKASMAEMLWFIDCHLANIGLGDYSKIPATITFNRDIMMNREEAIDNCKNSVGIVSTKTILANHPFVTDVDDELKELAAEKQQNMDNFGFAQQTVTPAENNPTVTE
jgi:SPP1 family phage portal protein